MAIRNQEFHPDVQNRDVLGKLLLTQKQRKRLLKWLLFTAVCLLGLLVQDVLMSRVDILGATTDLTACCILAVCILQGAHSGSIFALCAAAVFYFSGSAPGPYCILLLTAIGIFAAIGVAAMFAVAFGLNYHWLHYAAIPVMVLSFAMLLGRLELYPMLSGAEVETLRIPADGTFKGGFVKVSEGLKLWCQYNIDFEANRELLRKIIEE